MNQMLPSGEEHSLVTRRQIEEVCTGFEAAWQSGQEPTIADFLSRVAESVRPVLLQELIHLDLFYRRQGGKRLQLEWYQQQFPNIEAAWLQELDKDNQSALVSTISEIAASDTDQPAPLPQRFPQIRDYEIVGKLGQGGMGVVFKARDVRLNRLVALKMIRFRTEAGESEVKRFRTEAETVARLQHPNFVQIHEIGEHDESPYIVLEFCDGGSLAKKLDGTPLPAKEAAGLVETLARAVQKAHEARIVHRDLKPANVLLTGEGTPKITDFGLAKQLDTEDEQTRTGAIMGTPSYMAPEQAFGAAKHVGPAADIYALGVILYECLTGRTPFKGATVAETLDLVRHREPVAVRQLQPATPVDLETIALKCLQKDATKRYPTATALGDDLRRFLDGRPILARPLGPGARAWRWCRRNRVVAGLLATVFVVLLVGIASTTILWLHARASFQRAEAEWTRAESNYADAVNTVDEYFDTVAQNRLLHVPGMAGLRRELMSKARPFYEKLLQQRKDDPHMRFEVAQSIFILGDIERSGGDPDRAMQLFADARQRFEQLHREKPENVAYRFGLARTLRRVGSKHNLTVALEHFADLNKQHPGNGSLLLGECLSSQELAAIVLAQGDRREAEKLMRRGLQLAVELDQHDTASYREVLGFLHCALGQLLREIGKYEHAREELESARKILTRLASSPIHHQAVARYDLARTLGALGPVYIELRLAEQAEKVMLEAHGIMDQFVRDAPSVKEYRFNRAVNEHNLAHLYVQRGKLDDAERWCGQALLERERLVKEFPADHDFAFELAMSYRQRALVSRWQMQPEQQVHWNGKAVAVLRELRGRTPANNRVRDLLVEAAGGRGQMLFKLGRFAEALPDLDVAIADAGPNLQPVLRSGRAVCRAKMGNWKGAAVDIAAIPHSRSLNEEYDFARAAAVSSKLAAEDKSLSAEQQQQHAQQLVRIALRRLAGMRNNQFRSNEQLRQRIESESDFDPLRSRPDYLALWDKP